jgi:hypothetical protein
LADLLTGARFAEAGVTLPGVFDMVADAPGR